jgi:diguanylate cyclase (GGDEF)-like protein
MTAASAPTPTTPARIVIVDDEEPLRRLWARQLERAGHDCTHVGSTAEARALLEERPADLLICDLHMPGESGMTLLRDLHGRYPDMAKLMISGVGDSEVAGEAIKLGAYGYHVKPITPKQLLVSVSNALRQLELERARREDLDELGQTVARSEQALESERSLRVERETMAADSARRADEKSAVAASLRRRAKLLERLCTLQRDIPPRLPLPQVASALARTARELLEADAAEVWLLDPEDAAATALVAAAEGTTASHSGHEPAKDGPAGAALSRGSASSCGPDAGAEELGPRLATAGLKAAMAVPLREEGTVIGALLVGTQAAGRAYSDEEQEALAELGAHAALVMGAASAREHLGGAFRDPITRLPTRPEFVALAQQRVDSGDALQAPAAVVLLGIDEFGQLRPAGAVPDMLRAVAGALRDRIVGGAPTGYVGGGRFAILLDDEGSRADPLRVATGLHESIRAVLAEQRADTRLSASAGVAYGNAGVEELLRNAGAALFAARRRGGGQCESFRPGRGPTLRNDELLEADLMRAVELELITARYQPIVSLPHRAVSALQVVARWAGRSREPVAPSLFMPLAEEIGVVHDVERKLLEEAAAQAVEWGSQFRADRPLAISLPLSLATLVRPDAAAEVAAALERSGLRASKLIVEVDEHLLVDHLDELRDPLAEIAGLGVRLAVRDFGGRSHALHYLEEVPLAIVKTARSLVEGVGQDTEEDAPMRAVVALAKSYGLEVLAQGVERAPQMVKLRGMGCDLGQGPHFSMALDATRVTAMLQRARRGQATAATPDSSELQFSR